MNVSTPISIQELDRVHRISKDEEGKDRVILVKFATYRSRQRVFKERRCLRLNTRNVQAAANGDRNGYNNEKTTNSKIFINEDLCKVRSQLLYTARQAKKRREIADCWSFDGRIIIKDLKGSIKSISNLDELKNNLYINTNKH